MLSQLYALRAQVEALIIAAEDQLQAQQPVADPNGCPKCGAPEDKQIVAGGMAGQKTVKCQACGHVWTK